MVSVSLSYLFLWPSAKFAWCCKQKSAPSDIVLNPLHSSTPVPQCYLKHSGACTKHQPLAICLLCVCVWVSEHSNHEQQALHRHSNTKQSAVFFLETEGNMML